MSSRSLNRVTLIGNLTRDPELKYVPSGAPVCTFSIATNRSWTTGDGQNKEESQFHRIVAWQKLAELCGKFLSKGRKVYIEGRLTYRNYTGSDGQQRSVAEIIAEDFILLDNRKSEGSERNYESKENQPKQQEDTPVEHESNTHVASQEDKSQEDKIDLDDIPF